MKGTSILKRTVSIFQRLILGVGGQIWVSAANFALSLFLLSRISLEDFGVFSFIQILVFLSFSISNALLSSPLVAEIHRNNAASPKVLFSFFHVNMILGLAASLIISLVSITIMKQSAAVAVLFAFSSFFLFISRLARTYLIDNEKAANALMSDFSYSIVIFLGCGIGFLNKTIDIEHAVFLLSVSAFVSILTMGKDVVFLQLDSIRQGSCKEFIEGFRRHGKHTLFGVLTTELTGRSHSYIVSLFLGASAFAPLAAAAVFFRPISLIIGSLTQFERAKLARLLRDRKNKETWHELRFFYGVSFITWVLNILLVWVLVYFFFNKIFSEQYDYKEVIYTLVLYAAINAIICIRSPASALLQANADFKSLSRTTFTSSIVTVPSVIVCTAILGATWSLFGVLAGEIVAAVLILKLAKQKVPRT